MYMFMYMYMCLSNQRVRFSMHTLTHSHIGLHADQNNYAKGRAWYEATHTLTLTHSHVHSLSHTHTHTHTHQLLISILHMYYPSLPPSLPPSLTDQLTSSGELTGIQLLEDERAWLNRARREVESQGKKMLLQGLELMVSGIHRTMPAVDRLVCNIMLTYSLATIH